MKITKPLRVKRRQEKRRSEGGFTLVETMITLVMTGIMATGIIVFMINGLRSYGKATSKAYLIAQAQSGVDRISGDILLAANADDNNRIEDANSPGAPTNLLSWQSDNDTLILATAAEDTSRNILFADASNYISHKNNVIYYRDGTVLRKRVLATAVTGNRAITTCPAALATSSCPADRVVLENVASFVVTYRNHLNVSVLPEDARSVEVSVLLDDKKYATTTVNYKTRTVFRNE